MICWPWSYENTYIERAKPQYAWDERKVLYGSFTYSELSEAIERKCLESGASSELFQSNHEGDLIERIHNIDYDAIVINAGALTHYSYSLRDALELFRGIKIEVHISNIFARERVRSKSVISPVCSGTIAGLGLNGYLLDRICSFTS